VRKGRHDLDLVTALVLLTLAGLIGAGLVLVYLVTHA
jgi:hypothetical protein